MPFSRWSPALGVSTQPIVLPVINRNWQSEPDALGGRWNLNANLLDIVRARGYPDQAGVARQRMGATFRDGIGGQYEFTPALAATAIGSTILSPLSNPDLPSAYFPVNGMPAAEPINPNFVTGRVFPQVGLKLELPADPPRFC